MVKVAETPFEAATAYAQKHGLHALVIAERERIAVDRFDAAHTLATPHALYSGTKSFWGTAALCAVEDGLFDLDEPVVRLLPEFKADIRREITPRMLLAMSAGYGFGGLGSAVPTYQAALAIPLKNRPGETFTYGGVPLQVFGAFFARALAGETPHAYLARRVLTPAGVEIGNWRSLKDGTQPLPTGAFVSAGAWLQYGRYILAQRERFSAAFAASPVNARYGLCWWRSPAGVREELFYASGSAGQALYVVPGRDLVVVHFAKSTSYKHDAFLKRLLT